MQFNKLDEQALDSCVRIIKYCDKINSEVVNIEHNIDLNDLSKKIALKMCKMELETLGNAVLLLRATIRENDFEAIYDEGDE